MHHEQQMCALLGLRAFCRTPAPLARRRPVPAARSRVLCVAFLAGERAQSVGRTRVVRRWCHGPKPGVGPWVGRAVLSRTLGPYMTRYEYSRGAFVAPACLWGRLPALAEALATEYAQRAGDARPTITCASWRGMPATLCITGEWDTTAPVMHGRSFFEQVGASAFAPGGALFFRRGVRMTASTFSASCDARACGASYIRPAHAT